MTNPQHNESNAAHTCPFILIDSIIWPQTNKAQPISNNVKKYPCDIAIDKKKIFVSHRRMLYRLARPHIDTSRYFSVHMSGKLPLNIYPNPSEVISIVSEP